MSQALLNTQVTESHILLLTGAGASAPLGLWTMTNFLDSLHSKIDPSHPARVALDFLSQYFPDSQTDLEALIDAVRTLETFEIIANRRAQPDPDGFIASAAELRTLVRDLVIEKFAAVDPETTLKLYQPLWDALSEYDRTPSYIPLFTTNYDWAPETFASESNLKLLDGFQRRGTIDTWDRDAYALRSGRRPNESRDMALFKLHGSTSWYKRDGGSIEKYQLNQRLLNRDNVVIYPGRTKVESLDEPYQTSYQYFGACLREAEKLVVIGYRFGDLSIQRVIEAAIAEGAKFELIIANGPRFAWDDLSVSQAVIDRSHLIAERFSIPVRDGAIPSYCGRLRGYLSLGPLLDSFDDVDIDRIPGVVGWLHYRLQVPSQSRITFIGYIANNKDVTDLKPGSMVANHALRLQTHTASNFSEPIRVNKTRLFHLGIPIPTGAVTAIFMRIEGYDYPIHVTLHAS